MLSNIQEKYESLIKKREDLSQQLSARPSAVLCFKAGPDKWSIVDVIEHLVIAEQNLLEQLAANVPVSTLDPGTRTPKKHQTVIKVMERDIPVDVPDESLEPHGGLTLGELCSQWDDIRKKLQDLLAEIKPENEDDLVYRHPYGGPLDIAETLYFIDIHFDNHMRQIDRILTQSNSE
jgi:hypothetical protein